MQGVGFFCRFAASFNKTIQLGRFKVLFVLRGKK